MIVFPHAKINLGINVIGKRKNGLHTIESIFYPISLTDILEIVEFSDQINPIEMTLSGMVPKGDFKENLVYKAILLSKEQFKIPSIKVHLHKMIPSGAGLGGGSSDGTFTIKLLNKLFNLKLEDDDIRSLAGSLGSDCSYFVDGGSQLITGTGNILQARDVDLTGYYIVLVKPDTYISTKKAYSKIKPRIPYVKVDAVTKQNIGNWKENLKNDFEETVFSEYPEIGKIKLQLYQSGGVVCINEWKWFYSLWYI